MMDIPKIILYYPLVMQFVNKLPAPARCLISRIFAPSPISPSEFKCLSVSVVLSLVPVKWKVYGQV